MKLVPWGGKKELVPIDVEGNDIVVHQGAIAPVKQNGAVVRVRSRQLKIAGQVYTVDPQQLMRMIRQVTQTIGEYKDQDNPYAEYVVRGMRKTRSDMVSDLEHHFKIHWQIDEADGRSVFYM